MRILEHFFPDRELNLVTLRALAKDVADGKIASPVSEQTQGALTTEEAPLDDEGTPEEAEPVVESVNDLHEPLGCMMKDSRGRFRKSTATCSVHYAD